MLKTSVTGGLLNNFVVRSWSFLIYFAIYVQLFLSYGTLKFPNIYFLHDHPGVLYACPKLTTPKPRELLSQAPPGQ